MGGHTLVKIEVLYFVDCPHHRPTLDLARDVAAELGLEAAVQEVEVRDGEQAARLHFPGSPTVRVNGIDIDPAAGSDADRGLSCRMYGGSGIPPRELLISAILSSDISPKRPRIGPLATLGVPVAGLAALPICPACYPLYAGLLSSLGLTAFLDPGAQTGLTLVFLASAVGALSFRARLRRGYRPLTLGICASLLVLAGKFGLGGDAITYTGVALLGGASVWNVWPRKAAAPSSRPRAHRPRRVLT